MVSGITPRKKEPIPYKKEVYDVQKNTSKKDFIQAESAPPDPRAQN